MLSCFTILRRRSPFPYSTVSTQGFLSSSFFFFRFFGRTTGYLTPPPMRVGPKLATECSQNFIFVCTHNEIFDFSSTLSATHLQGREHQHRGLRNLLSTSKIETYTNLEKSELMALQHVVFTIGIWQNERHVAYDGKEYSNAVKSVGWRKSQMCKRKIWPLMTRRIPY